MNTRRKIDFILASKSAKRKQLLKKAGYKFDIIPSDIDENTLTHTNLTGEQYTRTLALAKAKNVAARFPEALVMAADTVAETKGRIIGKPQNAGHAKNIIKTLFSSPHNVITTVALIKINTGTQIVRTETTTIYPKTITNEQIDSYIKTGRWKQKAGAYAIKQAGDEFIKKIQGSATNVSGLPMELTLKLLNELLP